MWLDIKRIYSDSGAFARALPFLFLIPVLIEFAQHVVEINIGMYDSRAAARGVSADDSRLALGYAKVLALTLPGYWFVRFMAWDRSAAKARAVERPAAMLFVVQFAILAAVQLFGLFGPPVGVLLGLEGTVATIAAAVAVVIQTIIGVYLTAWFVAWPLGNAAIGPVRSFGVMSGSFWRAIGYIIAGALPLMALHYALGLGAIGLPRAVVWVMMAVDAIVVGFLALTMMGANYTAARRAAERKGVSLLP
ncbi:hypothetical protein M0208_17440 [Sphingomonas sp. SUN019]|uniref:hypothetical protein n=1 Tax=Sphingomonas sp. SUN019 TaxID=2937788 RepID=UPI0021643409|nr:hypothetical protein [Sphingomonas sp. SUN019]UVO52207.1 hypothetical protein M0208_17440 [Sphingomonas sp. SUN019]